MSKLLPVIAVTVLFLLCPGHLTSVTSAEDQPKPVAQTRDSFDKDAAEKQVKVAVQKFLEVWNTGDDNNVRKIIRYPFVTLTTKGKVNIANGPKEFPDTLKKLRTKGWHHSTFDSVKIIAIGPQNAHVRVAWTRHSVKNDPMKKGEILYVVTNREGEWRIQLRSVLNSKLLKPKSK